MLPANFTQMVSTLGVNDIWVIVVVVVGVFLTGIGLGFTTLMALLWLLTSGPGKRVLG